MIDNKTTKTRIVNIIPDGVIKGKRTAGWPRNFIEQLKKETGAVLQKDIRKIKYCNLNSLICI